MPILMVVAVSPMSVPGRGRAEAAGVVPDAAVAAAEAEAGAGADERELLEDCSPRPAGPRPAPRTPAGAHAPERAPHAAARAAGLSLFDVTLVSSTTSLPMSLDPAKPERSRQRWTLYRAVSKKIETDCAAEIDTRRGLVMPRPDAGVYSTTLDVNNVSAAAGGCKRLHRGRGGDATRNVNLYRVAVITPVNWCLQACCVLFLARASRRVARRSRSAERVAASGVIAAVDADHLAGDEARFVGAQEPADGGDVFGGFPAGRRGSCRAAS